ncbi:hypothetical protein [Croceicoccus mobilis]|uniref:Uncharacterized protein n=1 Tax=Croceicoccus mobilis TaxID=1703339 RepID=A0A916YTD1_9SPHN|nr:hypothetical protein [Croceicoccus mobilis]GGD59190.1 hypothetical protein GCM10010990_05660 [Croceicoccus mobilis]
MATTTVANGDARTREIAERKFFFYLALAIAITIVAGFSLNFAMGRSSLAVPLIYHAHGIAFFAWTGLFITQSGLIAADNRALHARLGMISAGLVPVMVVLGIWLMVVVMRRNGGPFFFDQNEFLFSNPVHLLLFAGLTFAALKSRRYSGWHRRLMLMGFAVLSGPGLGRLIPLPLMIPYAWRIMVLVVLIWPIIGMIRDLVKTGRVHPAWLWGAGALLVAQGLADLVAYSEFGIAFTRDFLAGTPGAERPMEAFLPPGFAM